MDDETARKQFSQIKTLVGGEQKDKLIKFLVENKIGFDEDEHPFEHSPPREAMAKLVFEHNGHIGRLNLKSNCITLTPHDDLLMISDGHQNNITIHKNDFIHLHKQFTEELPEHFCKNSLGCRSACGPEDVAKRTCRGYAPMKEEE